MANWNIIDITTKKDFSLLSGIDCLLFHDCLLLCSLIPIGFPEKKQQESQNNGYCYQVSVGDIIAKEGNYPKDGDQYPETDNYQRLGRLSYLKLLSWNRYVILVKG